MNTASFTNVLTLAQFCAELVRQGIRFNVREKAFDDNIWVVEMTGC